MNVKVATVINCIDGRVQEPVNNWMKAYTGANQVDVITEAGPDRIMASTATASRLILQRILMSRDRNHSEHLALVAHFGCRGNPVSKDTHMKQLHQAVKIIETWDLGMNIMLLWVNDKWEIELVKQIKP